MASSSGGGPGYAVDLPTVEQASWGLVLFAAFCALVAMGLSLLAVTWWQTLRLLLERGDGQPVARWFQPATRTPLAMVLPIRPGRDEAAKHQRERGVG